MARAFLIDAEERIITEIDFFGGWEMVSPTMGAQSWKSVSYGGIDNRSDVWIFNSGFLDNETSPTYWYQLDSQPPKAGRALIIGVEDDSGDYCDTTFERDELVERVVFTKRRFRAIRTSGKLFTPLFKVELVAPIIEEE